MTPSTRFFGQVVKGMEHLGAIRKGGEHNNGAITGAPDRIVIMRLAADAA